MAPTTTAAATAAGTFIAFIGSPFDARGVGRRQTWTLRDPSALT